MSDFRRWAIYFVVAIDTPDCSPRTCSKRVDASARFLGRPVEFRNALVHRSRGASSSLRRSQRTHRNSRRGCRNGDAFHTRSYCPINRLTSLGLTLDFAMSLLRQTDNLSKWIEYVNGIAGDNFPCSAADRA